MIESVKQWLKKLVAYIGLYARKVWEFPSHAWVFITQVWRYFKAQTAPLWRYAELVEYFEVALISLRVFLASISQGWREMRRRIEIMNRTRFSSACGGSGSWIDRTIYFGDSK
ncbi:MAG: hypothetical protein DRQ78_08470 [Epsilonproteobacteria bacterium]|nr:MAG: hypothetical protein DRQ78_08470 [Campylobacterota bacterium]